MTITIKSIFALCFLLSATTLLQAQVGVGTSTPAASAQLDVSSTTKGFLPPRVALVSTDNTSSPISSPATGLLVYNTAEVGSGATAVTPGYYYYSGSAWVPLANGVKKIAGPINTSSYTAGDVVYDQSSANYYFFKPEVSQSSSSFSNPTSYFAIFDVGRVVIRMRPDRSQSIASITLKTWGVDDGVLSMYSGLGTNSASCSYSNPVVAVDVNTLMGSSTSTSGSGSVTYTFGTPISVTANTDYYLTFSSACTSAGIGVVGNTTSTNFAISYGGTTIDQGIPAIRINGFSYVVL